MQNQSFQQSLSTDGTEYAQVKLRIEEQLNRSRRWFKDGESLDLFAGRQLEAKSDDSRFIPLVNRANRILAMLEVGAPLLILENECAMLKEIVDALC